MDGASSRMKDLRSSGSGDLVGLYPIMDRYLWDLIANLWHGRTPGHFGQIVADMQERA